MEHMGPSHRRDLLQGAGVLCAITHTYKSYMLDLHTVEQQGHQTTENYCAIYTLSLPFNLRTTAGQINLV